MSSTQSFKQYPICHMDGKKYAEQMIESKDGKTSYTFSMTNAGCEGKNYNITWDDSQISLLLETTHGDCRDSRKQLQINFADFNAETMNAKIPSNGITIEKPKIFTSDYSDENQKLFAMLNQGKDVTVAEFIQEIESRLSAKQEEEEEQENEDVVETKPTSMRIAYEMAS